MPPIGENEQHPNVIRYPSGPRRRNSPSQKNERTMTPVRLANPLSIPSSQLEDWGPVEEPDGERVGWVRGREHVSVLGGAFRVGVWECSPSRWRRRVMEPEFAHFVAGRARFVPDCGDAFDINSGDAVWFPANTTGVWEIAETLRKTYVIVAPGGVMRMIYMLFQRVSNRRAKPARD
jgi:uncharacterized cupin superfamily protein